MHDMTNNRLRRATIGRALVVASRSARLSFAVCLAAAGRRKQARPHVEPHVIIISAGDPILNPTTSKI
jgi:molybdopterin biosynthesis enzyme